MAKQQFLDISGAQIIANNIPKLQAGKNVTLTPDKDKPNKIKISSPILDDAEIRETADGKVLLIDGKEIAYKTDIKENLDIEVLTRFKYEQKKNDIKDGSLVLLTDEKSLNVKESGELTLIADSVEINAFEGSEPGLVPESTVTDQTKMLFGNGEWGKLTDQMVVEALGFVPSATSQIPVFSFDLSVDGDLLMHTADGSAAPLAYIAESGENAGCLMMDLGN